jgi:hypothetical protein
MLTTPQLPAGFSAEIIDEMRDPAQFLPMNRLVINVCITDENIGQSWGSKMRMV